jgi:hypothetical protein
VAANVGNFFSYFVLFSFFEIYSKDFKRTHCIWLKIIPLIIWLLCKKKNNYIFVSLNIWTMAAKHLFPFKFWAKVPLCGRTDGRKEDIFLASGKPCCSYWRMLCVRLNRFKRYLRKNRFRKTEGRNLMGEGHSPRVWLIFLQILFRQFPLAIKTIFEMPFLHFETNSFSFF